MYVCKKDLIDKLKKQNGVLEKSATEIIKIFEIKRTIFDARIKIDQELYNRVISRQRFIIGWERCKGNRV